MVIERALRRIEELKERPHSEGRGIALAVALIVVVVLFIGWGFTFVDTFKEPAAVGVPDSFATESSATTTGARVRIENEAAAAGAASGYIRLDEDGYQVVPPANF